MKGELKVLQREEEKSILGGAVTVITDPNDVPQEIWDIASGYVDDSGNWMGDGGAGSSGNDGSGNDTGAYSQSQYYSMCDAGTWTGGYVAGFGYVGPLIETSGEWTKHFTNKKDLDKFLSEWQKSPGYVEVEIYFYKGGTFSVVRDVENTELRCYPNAVKGKDGKYYHNGKEIKGFGHTHHNSSDPSPEDWKYEGANKNLDQSIFYNGAWHPYWSR